MGIMTPFGIMNCREKLKPSFSFSDGAAGMTAWHDILGCSFPNEPRTEANTERLYKLISLIIQAFHFLPTEKVKITSFLARNEALSQSVLQKPING